MGLRRKTIIDSRAAQAAGLLQKKYDSPEGLRRSACRAHRTACGVPLTCQLDFHLRDGRQVGHVSQFIQGSLFELADAFFGDS